MSKALIISDIHLHRWSYGSTLTKGGFNSRLAEQLNYLYNVRNMACENEVKHVICLGDLFHTHSTIHAEVLHAAVTFVQALKNAGIKFHCIVGNHDMASKDGKIHTLDWLRDYGTLVDSWSIFDIEGRRIAATPYTESEAQLLNVLNHSIDTELILLHQGINLNENQGSAWVINEIFTKEMVPEHVKRVLTGHYHRPVDDGKISIVGSPMQHNWSDCDDTPRGCMILDLDTLETKRIENTYSPKFLKVDYEKQVDIENKFVRMAGCPTDDMENTREKLLKLGAVSVEFEIQGNAEKNEVAPVFTSFDQIVSEYDGAVEGRRREVGKLLRDSMYETPNIQG